MHDFSRYRSECDISECDKNPYKGYNMIEKYHRSKVKFEGVSYREICSIEPSWKSRTNSFRDEGNRARVGNPLIS